MRRLNPFLRRVVLLLALAGMLVLAGCVTPYSPYERGTDGVYYGKSYGGHGHHGYRHYGRFRSYYGRGHYGHRNSRHFGGFYYGRGRW